MTTKLYVGNLSFDTDAQELRTLFSEAGSVTDVALVEDKFTGKSRGFAFVTMSTGEECKEAITRLNGREVQGRSLTVNEARPREERPFGGGGGGGGGGGRSFGGGKRAGGNQGGNSRGGFHSRY